MHAICRSTICRSTICGNTICRSCARLAIAGAAAALLGALNPTCPALAADKPPAYEADAGFDAAPQALAWYSEAIVALNRNINKDGFLLRTYGSLAVYQYASPIIASDTINGQLYQLDVMPGYQIVRGASTLGGYVGFDYQESSLQPEDPTNPLRGTATGLKVEGHYYFGDEKQPLDVRLVSEYSTAFATYYAELRVGARVWGKLFIGPDGEVDGDTGYNAQRLGAYAKYTFEVTKGMPLETTFVVGHQFVSGANPDGFGGGEGTYGTVELSTNF
jgi:Cellulose biosynthesis protein BcsS